MKSHLKSTTPFIVLFLSILGHCFADTQNNKTLEAPKVSAPIQVDGILDEAVWQQAQVGYLDNYYRVAKDSDKQQTKFRMAWDENNIYLAFDCRDQFITSRKRPRDGAPYFDDCAEIFLTPAPEASYFHLGIEINLLRSSNDFVYLWDYHEGNHAAVKSWNPEFDVAFQIDGSLNDNSDIDNGWTMEMAIPLNLFDTLTRTCPVEVGSQWSFLAVRQDRNDLHGDRRSIGSLYPVVDLENNGVHNPKSFGLVSFVD